MATIKVKAKPGLTVFFPRRIKAGPGAVCYQLTADEVIEVNGDEAFVIKRLRAGDLEIVRAAPIRKRQKKAESVEVKE